jgi:plastocyanin
MAAAVVAATGTVGLLGVGGASAAGNADVYSKDAPTNPVADNCFSTDAGSAACQPGEVANVTVAAGDTVTWHFDGSDTTHNAASSNAVPADPEWEPYSGAYVSAGSYSRRFTQPGVYKFVCEVHPSTMTGTITVEGEPVETPTGTPTEDPTVTVTPTPTVVVPQPGGDDHTQTPAPSGGADAVKPRIRGVQTKVLRRGVRVRFRLSEPATVTIDVRRAGKGKVYKTARVQAPAGARTVTARGKRLTRGRYVVQLRARDALGNRSSLARKSLRVGRR